MDDASSHFRLRQRYSRLLTSTKVSCFCNGSFDVLFIAVSLQVEQNGGVTWKLDEPDTDRLAADVERIHDSRNEWLDFVEVGASDTSRAVNDEDDVYRRWTASCIDISRHWIFR